MMAPQKEKEKLFGKSDMFSTPSIMKSGKNINLQTSPKLKMKVVCMRPYKFTHAIFLSLLEKYVHFETLALSKAFEPKEPNLNKSSASDISIISLLSTMSKF
jgi:hypothetical protein